MYILCKYLTQYIDDSILFPLFQLMKTENCDKWDPHNSQGFIQALTGRLPELKTQSFKPKYKKVKNCLDFLKRAFFILFSPLGVISGVKSLYKKKNYSPKNETCVRARCLFLNPCVKGSLK